MPERKRREINGVQIQEFRVSGNLVRGIAGEVARYRHYVVQQEYDILMVKAAQQWTFDALIPVLDSIAKPKIFVPCGFSGLLDAAYGDYFRRMPDWLRKFDKLIFYSNQYRDIELARKFHVDNLSVIPNGADEREFGVPADPGFRHRHGIKDDAFLILTVGSLTGFKGHLELALAFEKCDFGDRPACLILNGNIPRRPRMGEKGWFEQTIPGRWLSNARTIYEAGGLVRLAKWQLRPLLEALGLGWLLERMGYLRRAPRSLGQDIAHAARRINSLPGRRAILCNLPRAELVQAYLNSDLFVFASRIECSPLVLFESAAAGLPFLSVPVGNAAEIAKWTRAGVICPANVDSSGYTNVDIEVLAAELSRLSGETERLAQLAKDGRRNWEQRFTWERISRLYENVLEECVQKVEA
jgi:glycosyltransferase involved in cell wall biosynthesis